VNFNFITTRLAVGSAITGQADVQALLAAGVTHIIDCCVEEDDSSYLAGAGCSYLWNPTSDDGQTKQPAWFQRSIEFYCHCSAGINRGPSTAYSILRSLGFGRDEMLTLIRLKRPATIVGIRYAADADAAIKALGYE
jgi:hypothetical protein